MGRPDILALAQIADLIAAGLVEVGESLEFPRPRRGELFRATVLADGTIQSEDGRIWPSPSRAAMSAANVPSYDGWHASRLSMLGGNQARPAAAATCR